MFYMVSNREYIVEGGKNVNYIEFLKFSKSGKEKQKNKNIIYPDSISEKYSLLGDDI